MRPPRSERRNPRLVGLRLALAALVAVIFLVATAPDYTPSGGGVAVRLASGTLSHDNSRDGAAILTATNIWPGWSGDGDVTITNDGSAGSWLRLTEAAVEDLPGPGGGLLSSRLVLSIDDVTVPGFEVPVYSGALGAVDERWLGRMEPGDARTYRFRTSMPAGAGDNAYQAASLSVRFEWAVSDVDPDGGEPPPPPPPPPPSPDPVPTPNPNPQPTPSTPTKPPVQVVPDGPPVVVVDRTELGVRLAVPTTQRPMRAGRLRVLASCTRRCRATFRGRLAPVGATSHRHRMGAVSRTLPAGAQRRVKLRLGKRSLKAARRALRRGRSVRGQVRIVARDNQGNVARARQRVRLVLAKRP